MKKWYTIVFILSSCTAAAWQRFYHTDALGVFFVSVLVWTYLSIPVYYWVEYISNREMQVRAYQFKLDMAKLTVKEKEYPELPPDPVIFSNGQEYKRMFDEPIEEWVRVAKQIQTNDFRIRSREMADDVYVKACKMFGRNEYVCTVKGKTYHFTDWGKWVVNYLAALSPSEYGNVRESVRRRLAHTPTHTESE